MTIANSNLNSRPNSKDVHVTRTEGDARAEGEGVIIKGVGGVTVAAIFFINGLVIIVIVWLLIAFAKVAPRNADGSVTILGFIDLSAEFVGPPPRSPKATDLTAVHESSTADVKSPVAGAPSADQLAGVWKCGNYTRIMFTANERVAIKYSSSGNTYEGVFATWNDEPYEFTGPRTMKVGETEAHVELNEEGTSLLVMGSGQHFNCTKEAV